MNKRKCINLHGLREYESPLFVAISHFEKSTFEESIRKYSPRLRREYCTFNCPIQQRCKFENRYRNNK